VPSRPRTAPPAQLRHGLLPLPHLAADRPTLAAPHPLAADARTFAPAHRGAVSPGRALARLDAYLSHQLKVAGVSQPLFDDTARQALYQATKGIPRKINKLAITALRLAVARKASVVNEAILLDATSEALL